MLKRHGCDHDGLWGVLSRPAAAPAQAEATLECAPAKNQDARAEGMLRTVKSLRRRWGSEGSALAVLVSIN